jgi:tRNA pseudouridine32 synthase/23S rRNA pseudouridine746 synthase
VPKPLEPAKLSPEEIALVRSRVIYEDAAVLVLDKPAGLSSQGGRIAANTLDDMLWAFARQGHARPRLIHRLDRDTSGVILTAKTKPAAGFLGKALMAKRFRKTYLAVLAAAPDPKGGVIDMPLRRDSIGREVSMKPCAPDHPEAETALTRYRTLAHNDVAALVELSPETGRMHQLRAHLASIGRPILGDPRYGGALTLGGAPVPRLMLHAARLRFPHPDGGDKHIEAPIPADMAALMAAAGLPEQIASAAR